jgi:hypothetical protein
VITSSEKEKSSEYHYLGQGRSDVPILVERMGGLMGKNRFINKFDMYQTTGGRGGVHSCT